jgi:hypothetical protein
LDGWTLAPQHYRKAVFNVFALVVPSLGVAARPHQASNAFLYHQVVDSFVGSAKENTYIVLGKNGAFNGNLLASTQGTISDILDMP